MKKYSIILVLVSFILNACGDSKPKDDVESKVEKQEKFIIEGKIENGLGAVVYLGKAGLQNVSIVASDTADKDGNFHLEGYTREKFVGILNFQNFKKIYLVVDTASHINLQIPDENYDNYTLEGSEESKEFIRIRQVEVQSEDAIVALRKQAESLEPNDERLEKLRQQFADTINHYQDEMVKALKHSNSVMTQLYFMYTQDNLNFDDSTRMQIYERALASGLENDFVRNYIRGIQAELSTSVGQKAPEITLQDTAGQVVSLASLRGKIVLIDFWASWCKPCRMENPNVLRMYEKYKDKGFEIFGVSLDQKMDAWKKAIHDDGIYWYHVSDLRGWQASAAKLYAVNSIPSTFLIDREGKIIAKNLRGEELENKVEEVLEATP